MCTEPCTGGVRPGKSVAFEDAGEIEVRQVDLSPQPPGRPEDGQLAAVERRMVERQGRLEARVANMEPRLANIEPRLANIEPRLTNIERDIRKLLDTLQSRPAASRERTKSPGGDRCYACGGQGHYRNQCPTGSG